MKYKIGGTLTSDASSYVERQSDTQLYNALKQGEFCYVLNSRQMGKSSLMVRTSYRLQQEGFKCTTIDMTNIGSENISPLQWYKGIVADLWSSFNLREKNNFKIWWEEQEGISLLQKLSKFICDVLLVQFPHERIFIFVDEIDSILSLDFPVDDFFALIRFCYNQRAINPEYERITFAIFGVAAPSDLIQDKKRTPFNIGQAIELNGFKLDEAQPLAQGLNLQCNNEKKVLKEILYWTGGQPFLTQKLCYLVANSKENLVNEKLAISPGTEASVIAQVVRSRIIDNWESQDKPEHLNTIRARLLSNEKTTVRRLGIYQQILSIEEVLIDDSREHIELLLSGLVVNKDRKLQVRNPIYKTIFNQEWVVKQLENLRPYAQQLKAWVSSQQQDESQLIKGRVLQEALAWSHNKKLLDIDYRFLTASQELVKREIQGELTAKKIEVEKAQFALAAANEANRLLTAARKRAKIYSAKLPLKKSWIYGWVVVVTCLVILLRYSGLLQTMEWSTLDNFFQKRPQAGVDTSIAVITIDEADIRQFGHYPISDKILVQALENLKTYQPRVIGLDLFRDLPVEPGYKELAKFFQTTPNIIGLNKIVSSKVSAPPILAKQGQVGFADQVLDGDGKVRRALLSVRSANGKVNLSLGLQLALNYLKADGITPRRHPKNRHHMQIGKALLIPFQPFDGGYTRADAGGYQILLNYHGTEKQFQSFSLTALLQQQIPKEKLQNRIILIGKTAESVNDFFQTPYSSRLFDSAKQMPGVFIHANTISQIVKAAISGKGIIRTSTQIWEITWIFLLTGAGAFLSLYLKSPRILIAIVALSGITLIGFSYLAFLQDWWIPIYPPLLGFIIATIVIPIFTNKQLEKTQLRRTVELLVAAAKEQPATGQIAIEYLKQGESKENQQLIDVILQECGING
ncbi:molecular chaperone TorD [Calothrix sp. HK-06]|nr:molecular chaperone TorD [Calothrix sp. HK-06]